MTKERNRENVYAYNDKLKEVFVDDVESGKKGYFCLGCQKPMQAVKSKLGRANYFRHDAEGQKNLPKCTYSDETYRHKLAKEILQRIKKIKVPAVYKFPPKGTDGQAYLLQASQYIKAHYVGVELTAWEDEDLIMRVGKARDGTRMPGEIRPDITFFNNQNKPILFIEIVATHKPDEQKLLKYKCFGVDAIQVKIPKSSPGEIEKVFDRTINTNWIYNGQEQHTNYVQVSESDSDSVPPAEDLPREFYEETFRCRKAEIGNLIRRIGACLESEHYRSIEGELRTKISEVEKSTENLFRAEEEHRGRVQERIDNENKGEREKIESETGVFESAEAEFRDEKEDLESRYNKKARELRHAQRDINSQIAEQNGKYFDATENFGGRRKQFGIERERIQSACEEERGRIESIKFRRESLPIKYEGIRAGLINKYDEEEAGIEGLKDREQELFRASEESIRGKFEEYTREAIEKVEKRNIDGADDYTIGIRRILQEWRDLNDIKDEIKHLKRIRAAYECFKTGSFKNWDGL